MYLAPQNIPRAISVLTLGNKVVLLYCISLTHTSLDPYTHHSKLIINTDPLKPSTMFKKHTFRLGDIHLVIPPSPLSSVSGTSVSGASVSGTSVSETVTAPTNDTNDHIIWRCMYITSALNTGSSNARTVTLNENLLLFGHDSHFKSNNTFDLIIFRENLYIYTCKINKHIP